MTTAEPAPADATLLATVAAGGPPAGDAWAALVARYAPRMYAVARSFGLDRATAEDLVQTGWLRLLERMGQLREPEALGAWLCVIVRNEALRYLARRRELPAVLALDHQPDPTDPAEAGLLRAERVRALRLAFSRLGEDCRQLLRLLVAEPPLSYDEIAAATGRPRGSLGPSRRRCLEQLRTRLPAGFDP